MTARLNAVGGDNPDAALLGAVNGDDPLAIFPPEPQPFGNGPADRAAWRMADIGSQAPFVPFAMPNENDRKSRAAGVLNHLKRVVQALDTARDIDKTIDTRLAALRGLDQEVQDRTKRLELMNQDLRALETTVTAFEHRAQLMSTSLGRDVAACEAREAAIVDAMEQLGRRAAATIDGLEGRVGDCEARADVAERKMTRLRDASSPTLGEDLNPNAEQQSRARAVYQQLDCLEESIARLEQRAAAAVGEVTHATRAKDELQRELVKCHQQLERLTTSAHQPLITLPFRGTAANTWRALAPTRPIFGGATLALSAAIVLLVGNVWRSSPAGNQRSLRSPALESRGLTVAPTFTAPPRMQLTADGNHDGPEATRPAPAQPAGSVPRTLGSGTLPATRRVSTAALSEQSLSKGAATPRFVGTLLIESDPAGAAVFVNQKPVGDTPVFLKDLRAGSYVVRLEHEGYQRWSTAATVSAVREERVKAKLEHERSR